MLWPSASLRKDLLLLSKLKKVLLKNPFDTVCTFFSGCVICNVTTSHCLEAPKTSNVEGSNLAWVQIRKKWIKISGRIFLWLFSSIKVQIVHWGKIFYKVQFSKVDCIVSDCEQIIWPLLFNFHFKCASQMIEFVSIRIFMKQGYFP